MRLPWIPNFILVWYPLTGNQSKSIPSYPFHSRPDIARPYPHTPMKIHRKSQVLQSDRKIVLFYNKIKIIKILPNKRQYIFIKAQHKILCRKKKMEGNSITSSSSSSADKTGGPATLRVTTTYAELYKELNKQYIALQEQR